MGQPSRPVFIGTVAVDALRADVAGTQTCEISLGWGGVTSNMACAAGTLGVEPFFISASYAGEFRLAVSGHLAANGVTWLPSSVVAELPVFSARIGSDGDVFAEEFVGKAALNPLTPDVLVPWRSLIVSSSAVVTCTDVSLETLRWIRDLTRQGGTPLWLLSSDSTEAHKLSIDGDPPDFAVMNYAELSMRNAGPPHDTAAILRAGAHVTAPAGRCLITLGEYGSLLVCPDDGLVHHQSAPAIKPGSVTVRAGDVLAGCLLAARLAGANWEAALQEATARTASYLRSRGSARARPYALLLSPPAEIEKGNSISGDEKLRFLAALD